MKNKNKKSQTALEFIFMFSFMFILFIGMMGALSNRLNDAKKDNEQALIKNTQDMIIQEIKLSEITEDGYFRRFELPNTINGGEYSVAIQNNMTLVITKEDKEFIKILPFNVTGNIIVGENNITKKGDTIIFNIGLKK